MPKTKEDIVAILKAIEAGDVEKITSLTDKEGYVSAFDKISKESAANAKNAKEAKSKLEGMEKKNTELTERYNKVFDYIGLDVNTENLDDALESLRIKQSEEQQKRDGANTAKLKNDIAQLQTKLNEHQRALKEANERSKEFERLANDQKGKRQNLLRDAALNNALIKNKAVRPEQTARMLRDNVRVQEDDTVVYVTEDGSEVTVNEGVKSFLDACPEFCQNNQISGAGGGNAIGGGRKLDFDKMSLEEFEEYRAKGLIK